MSNQPVKPEEKNEKKPEEVKPDERSTTDKPGTEVKPQDPNAPKTNPQN